MCQLGKVVTEIFVIFIQQTDKASMLDEAIEYLKQLQLQVQVRG